MKKDCKNNEGFCVKCGTCNTLCPVYLATGNEIHSPRGKQHLTNRIEKAEVSSHYAEIFSQCLLCGACREACPRNLDTPELVIKVRSELPRLSGLSFLKYVSRKALVHPSVLGGLTWLGGAANTLLGGWLPRESGLNLRLQGFEREAFKLPVKGYMEKLRAESVTGKKKMKNGSEAGISFFIGCLANHLQPEIAESTQILVMKSSGRKAHVPLAQTCCGMAALAAGRVDEARDLAQRNIKAFEENDSPILTSCSSCYYQLKSYNDLFAEDPEWQDRACRFVNRLQEFSTFFLERFGAEKTALQSNHPFLNTKILYHDPCHLRFKLHITKEPRQLLQLIPGVELLELPDGPRCCGQGGLFQVAHPDLAMKIQARLMDDFANLETQTVLTACSGCLLQWQRGMAMDGKGEKVEHLAVFMAKRLQ
jgi:glycolate oxidase iron-sulfur subunit